MNPELIEKAEMLANVVITDDDVTQNEMLLADAVQLLCTALRELTGTIK